MLGNMIPPVYAPNGGSGGAAPATNTTTTAFTGGAWTFTKTAEATTAEDIVTFTISDALTSYLRLRNYDNTDASFVPELVSINAGADPALVLTTDTGADTGTQPSLFLNLFNNGGTGTTRPALKLNYQATTLLEVSGTGAWTFTRPAQASTAEAIATFGVSDDATSLLTFENDTSAANTFRPVIRGLNASTFPGLNIIAQSTTDSGSTTVFRFTSRIGTNTAVATRPAYEFYNGPNLALSLLPLNSGANSALSWGTQADAVPAFTTRSAGTRLVLYNAIGAAAVDNAIGTTSSGAYQVYSIPQATSSYRFTWYAGTTNIALMRGDGQLTTTGSKVDKLRVALTTPVTVVAGTDYIVVSNLTTPAAVAVNLPATPTTGLTYIIKDGKGDAAANNITITPAAGNIDGVGTLVIAANYGRAVLTYNGTEWNVIT